MNLYEPTSYWGVASNLIADNPQLFTRELFVFKDGAEKFIQDASATVEVSDLTPVLVSVSVVLCSPKATLAFDKRQKDWLAARAAAKTVAAPDAASKAAP
jgi:hypothetical protein